MAERTPWKSDRFTVRLYREDLNFSAGHISTYGDEVEGQHGHNYRLSVEFEGVLDEDCLVVDFRTVKSIVRTLIQRFNHRTLVPALHPRLEIERQGSSTRLQIGRRSLEFPSDDLVFLEVANLTSEMLAWYVCDEIRRQLPEAELQRLHSIRVEIIESPGQSAAYRALLGRDPRS